MQVDFANIQWSEAARAIFVYLENVPSYRLSACPGLSVMVSIRDTDRVVGLVLHV
jgi:hypothetical protein